jgi:hypothetical protein
MLQNRIYSFTFYNNSYTAQYSFTMELCLVTFTLFEAVSNEVVQRFCVSFIFTNIEQH